MRLLYLDSMDIANVGDGIWGPEPVRELAETLTRTGTRLALSTLHFIEAAGAEADSVRRRFEALFDAGIEPVTFGDDPRDWEIYLAHHFLTGAALPRPNGILPILREELPAILEGTRNAYSEMRTMQVQGSKAEFLSINAGPRSGEARVRETLAQAAKVRRRHLRAGIRKFGAFDLSKTMDERVKQRYHEVHGNAVQADLEATKKLSRSMMKRGRRMLPQIRGMMEANGIDLENADRDITWNEALERVMINQSSRALIDWDVPPEAQRLMLADRIQYVLESARRLGGTRVPEPGDEMDAAHAVYLSAVALMTADKRTTSMLHAAKEPRIRELARARLRRGGNVNLFREALEALRKGISTT